jgi:hypothetical protein
MQLYADLQYVASVRSQLLEYNVTDAGSVWNNTEQLIAQLQVIRDTLVLRQVVRRPCSADIADCVSANDEHTYPT